MNGIQHKSITTAIVSNLAIDKHYDFKVRAFNECGWGPFSSVVTKRTRAIEAPEPPCVDSQEAGDTFVRIKWDIDPSNFKYAIEKWHIQYSECKRLQHHLGEKSKVHATLFLSSP